MRNDCTVRALCARERGPLDRMQATQGVPPAPPVGTSWNHQVADRTPRKARAVGFLSIVSEGVSESTIPSNKIQRLF